MSKDAHIKCPASLDISVAQEIHAQLRDALAPQGNITLDAAAVERADTAALAALTCWQAVAGDWRGRPPGRTD